MPPRKRQNVLLERSPKTPRTIGRGRRRSHTLGIKQRTKVRFVKLLAYAILAVILGLVLYGAMLISDSLVNCIVSYTGLHYRVAVAVMMFVLGTAESMFCGSIGAHAIIVNYLLPKPESFNHEYEEASPGEQASPPREPNPLGQPVSSRQPQAPRQPGSPPAVATPQGRRTRSQTKNITTPELD